MNELLPSYVRAETLAKIYDVTPRAIYNWKAQGRIPHISIGKTIRFEVNAVARAIQAKEGK